MYTHSSCQTINYLQYTHLGKHLGSVLEPNSDQLSFRMYIMPLHWMQFEVWAKSIRHGNGSDYGDGSVNGDGSVFDDGILPDGTYTFTGPSSFLIQDTLEKVKQLGLTMDLRLPIEKLDISIKGGYVLELIQNKDLNPGAADEINHIVNISLSGFPTPT